MIGYTYCACGGCSFEVVDDGFCAYCEEAGCEEEGDCLSVETEEES